MPEHLFRPSAEGAHHYAYENITSRDEPAEFVQMVRDGAEGWDGSEPLRPAAT